MQEIQVWDLQCWVSFSCMAKGFSCVCVYTHRCICMCVYIYMCVYMGVLCAKSCPTLCNPLYCSLPGSSIRGIFSDKNTGVGCHFLLQGIFPTQRSNLCLLWLLHCKWILYLLSHGGSSMCTYICVCVYIYIYNIYIYIYAHIVFFQICFHFKLL